MSCFAPLTTPTVSWKQSQYNHTGTEARRGEGREATVNVPVTELEPCLATNSSLSNLPSAILVSLHVQAAVCWQVRCAQSYISTRNSPSLSRYDKFLPWGYFFCKCISHMITYRQSLVQTQKSLM